LILVQNHNFANNLGLDLHIRTTIRRGWSFISEAALKIGKDILEVRGGGEFSLNGKKSNVLPATVGGFAMTHVTKTTNTKLKRDNPGRISIFTVDLGPRGMVEIKTYNEFLAVFVQGEDHESFGNSVGLMGRFRDGAKLARDHVTVLKDNNIAFGMEWQVRDSDPHLFQTIKGSQFPAQCRLPNAAKRIRRRRLEEIGISWDKAQRACSSWPEEGRDACIYDVLSTGDLEMADADAM